MISYSQVKNPQWADIDKTKINCEVNFEHLGEEFVIFTANPNDIYQHSKEIFERCIKGEFGPIADLPIPKDAIKVVDASSQ